MITHALIDSVKTEAYRLLNLIAQRDCNNEACTMATSPHRSVYRVLHRQDCLRRPELCRGDSTNRIEQHDTGRTKLPAMLET